MTSGAMRMRILDFLDQSSSRFVTCYQQPPLEASAGTIIFTSANPLALSSKESAPCPKCRILDPTVALAISTWGKVKSGGGIK